MTPLDRYDLAIERLSARIHDLRRAHPRPMFNDRTRIQHLEAQRSTLVSNRYKLRAAQEAVAVYSEQVETHGKEHYSGALVVARRAVAYYEGLAPDETELAQGG